MPTKRWIVDGVMIFLNLLQKPGVAAIAPMIFCIIQITPLCAQERVRTSAGRLPIESFRSPNAFLHLGPLEEQLNGSVGFSYTDNSALSNSNKVSRLSIFQSLDLESTWVLSHLNQLQFVFGGKLTEDFFGNGKSHLNLGVNPGSKIEFQFSISNFRIRLFDRFSYVQDPTSDPTATNTTYLNSLTNTIGAIVDADFNLAILSFTADYTYNNESGSNVQGQQSNSSTTGTRSSLRFGSAVSFQLTPTILYGINDTVTFTTGSSAGNGQGNANVNSLSIGPFIRGKLSRLTDFDLAAGASFFDTEPSIPPTYYYSAAIRHRINRNLQLILSASHELIFTTGTDLTEETALRGGAEFNLTRFIAFSTFPFLSFGNEKTGNTPGNFTQYGISATLNWRPHRRWSTALTYDFIRRTADTVANRYIQNTIAFQVNYAF